MRLAAHLSMTVADLSERMSSAEFAEWLAYDLEYGLADAYFTVGKLGPATVNIWQKHPYQAKDFVPFFAPPRKKQTPQDMMALFKPFAKSPTSSRV